MLLVQQSPLSFGAWVKRYGADVLLWSLILAVLTGGVWAWQWWWLRQSRQLLHATFHDVNEVRRGAIVRFMGVDIGYVEKITLTPPSNTTLSPENTVDVVMKTFPGTPRIPEGATVTIQYTGLAGGKSMEVLPLLGQAGALSTLVDTDPLWSVGTGTSALPKRLWAALRERKTPVELTSMEPIRIGGLIRYASTLLKAQAEAAHNVSAFFGREEQTIAALQRNIAYQNSRRELWVNRMEASREGLADLSADYHAFIQEGGGLMQRLRSGSQAAQAVLGQPYLNQTVLSFIDYQATSLALTQEQLQATANPSRLQAAIAGLHQWQNTVQQFETITQHATASLAPTDAPPLGKKSRYGLTATHVTPAIWREQIRGFGQGVRALNARVSGMSPAGPVPAKRTPARSKGLAEPSPAESLPDPTPEPAP